MASRPLCLSLTQKWLVAYSTPSHYLDKSCVIIIWTDHRKQTEVKFESKYKMFHLRKCIWIYRLRNGGHFFQGEMSWPEMVFSFNKVFSQEKDISRSVHLNHWGLVTHIQRSPLQWRHNECVDVSNHQPHHCLLNHLFRRRSKKTSKLQVTGLYAGNSPVTGEFPTQRASNA